MSYNRGDSRAGIDEETRRQLVHLARRPSARRSAFSLNQPTEWCPNQVLNPDGVFDSCFTSLTAWEFIATRLEEGEEVEVIELRHPKGAKGYVLRIDLGPKFPRLYVKLQMRGGVIFGRSFHYSEYD